jgi:hypothetical protein
MLTLGFGLSPCHRKPIEAGLQVTVKAPLRMRDNNCEVQVSKRLNERSTHGIACGCDA